MNAFVKERHKFERAPAPGTSNDNSITPPFSPIDHVMDSIIGAFENDPATKWLMSDHVTKTIDLWIAEDAKDPFKQFNEAARPA